MRKTRDRKQSNFLTNEEKSFVSMKKTLSRYEESPNRKADIIGFNQVVHNANYNNYK